MKYYDFNIQLTKFHTFCYLLTAALPAGARDVSSSQ